MSIPSRSHKRRKILLCLALGFHFAYMHFARAECPTNLAHIHIHAPGNLTTHPGTSQTLADVKSLLAQAFPLSDVTVTSSTDLALTPISATFDGSTEIFLPEISENADTAPSRFTRTLPYQNLNYPDHDYEWNGSCDSSHFIVSLKTTSHPGVTFALYGLLQEKMGFRFIHPRQTIIPHYRAWPLPGDFHFAANARFDKKGFHLHTMHPTELTDSIHDATQGVEGLTKIHEYLNWLVRNGQNAFQFYLLRTIDPKIWPAYAKEFVLYGKSRGIVMGVSFSMAMFQQLAWRAFDMMTLLPGYTDQMKSNLDNLFQVPWDFAAVDYTTGEYFPDYHPITDKYRETLSDLLLNKYKVRLYHKVHVIPESVESDAEIAATGIQIHSVMCYSITEPKAPVYGFVNQHFVYDRAELEVKRRESWYFPENAYWVTFDSDVPLMLLPYLDSRLADMQTVQDMGVTNHIAFSSGWEWGYWQNDWMVARWSWDYGKTRTPMDGIESLFNSSELTSLWRQALELQNEYLKNRELLRYLPPATPMDEALGNLISPFQPRPEFTAQQMTTLNPGEISTVKEQVISDLESYSEKVAELSAQIKRASSDVLKTHPEASQLETVAWELIRGFEITGLRAKHRSLVIQSLLLNHQPVLPLVPHSGVRELINQAAVIRERAQDLVREQEKIYRYPVELIAGKHDDFTAYHFGYLYPVHRLHFWQREERQVILNRFDAFYNNIWSFPRILGI